MWQYIVLSVVLALAIGYVCYRIWLSFKVANDPCGGCTGCAIHDQLKKQRQLKGRKKPACYK